jgi:hypothetical protein
MSEYAINWRASDQLLDYDMGRDKSGIQSLSSGQRSFRVKQLSIITPRIIC